MNAALGALLDGLDSALGKHIRQGEGLFDPLDMRPSPNDHYGHVCAALALACSGDRAWALGRQALDAWLHIDTDELGHLPFNRLALLLLRSVLRTRGLSQADENLIAAGLSRCGLKRRYPSNNWSLLAQTCRLIEASADRKAAESRRLCALLARWTTTKGCFIDFPAKPGKRFSTPLAYHHKALFLTALACWFHDDADLARHARRLADWLIHCWDPAGYAGGFGRSTHSLFGDGCLLAALLLLGIDDGEQDQPISALAQRLMLQRRPDGLLWLNPAGHESGAASWDGYMHLSVYNAWAAAIVGAALQLRQAGPLPGHLRATAWTAARTGLFHDEEAGLACLRTKDGLNVLISTHGQPPQSYGRDEAEFRYAGGMVFHLRAGGSPPLLPPALRTTRDALLAQPPLAGWTPVIVANGIYYVLDEFESCVLTSTEHGLKLSLAGQPCALFRQTPSNFPGKVLHKLDWRMLGGRLGRNTVLRRARLTSVQAKIQLELRLDRPDSMTLSQKLEIHSRNRRILHLNPESSITLDDTASMGTSSACPHGTVQTAFPSSIPNCLALSLGPRDIEATTPYTSNTCIQLSFDATRASPFPPS